MVILSGNARHTVLANGDKSVPSAGSEKYKLTAGEVCRGDKAGGVVKNGDEGTLIQTADSGLIT